ncbi:hypothetical protein [Qipengyuania thermophila]|uniref:hypothetical protein n=1 Tax=Qipengyuania thermophila TaxID=2509361 RepID=UPI0013ED9D13|nr:hypothetical protein [Qipengyuania thermophila]
MLRLLALGAIGYFGYHYAQRTGPFAPAAPRIGTEPVAGGPLSDQARIVSDPRDLP